MAASFCESCGAQIKEGDRFCENCGAAVAAPPPSPEAGVPPAVQKEKNPTISLVLSFFFPGLGSIYNGDTLKGIAICIGTIIGSLIFLIPGIIVWIYGLYDAITTAKKMNAGLIPYKEANTMVMIGFVVAVLTIAISFFAIMEGL